LQLPKFYPAPDFPAESTLPESPENLEVWYVRELLKLQQRREIRQKARTAKRPELSGSDVPGTLDDDETFDVLQWRLHAQLECLLCVETMVPPTMVCKNGHMICHNCRDAPCEGSDVTVSKITCARITHSHR